jgi:hypothetical protein
LLHFLRTGQIGAPFSLNDIGHRQRRLNMRPAHPHDFPRPARFFAASLPDTPLGST